MTKIGFIYIMSNENKTLYIGVTSNLSKRIFEHKEKKIKGFTSKYNLVKLVYFEEYPSIKEAITREKQLKNWHRDWKLNLIRKLNPDFEGLSSMLELQ